MMETRECKPRAKYLFFLKALIILDFGDKYSGKG
jgi:hypothetical protein